MLDPDAAAGRFAELGAVGRSTAVETIARRYAEREPFSALAWARQQGLKSGELAVVEVAAKTNPQRAFELALQTSEAVRDEALRSVIAELLRRDATSAPALASRLETLVPGSRRYEAAMTSFVSSWVNEKPDDAFAWIVANAARLPDEAHAAAARRVPADAFERIAERLPAHARAIWLAESR